MITLNEIRNLFLDFFARNSHKIISSSQLIPQNDPTLLFTNAGMVQFKDYFLGRKKTDFSCVASVQKCLRAGGKHNDLENVGYTNRHHTFFEMLGNFSFGGYGKEEAIKLAWEFITKELGLRQDKLYITVYHTDEEATNLWKKISNVPNERIVPIASNDNFWSMGETGPCGPCSEIFYDNGDSFSGGLPGSQEPDGDRFVEIWNLVFMQYNRDETGNKTPLPSIGIDTGMGLERISAVMQGVCDNYDTDLFTHLIQKSQKISGNYENKTANKIIADHTRAASFLIADGVMPSNQGRGYVLRRIIRRAVRFAYQIGYNNPILHELFPTLKELMVNAYPELSQNVETILHTLKTEEEKFFSTLGNGLEIMHNMAKDLKPGSFFSGQNAFKLYDTYGFPLDITIDLLKEKDIHVDVKDFNQEMAKQKQQAKEAWVGSGEKGVEKIWFEVLEKFGKTEFIKENNSSCEIKGIIKNREILSTHSEYNKIRCGDQVIIILKKTPFYAESGGQLGDTGILTIGSATFKVTDTKKMLDGIHAHISILQSGKIDQDYCLASFNQQRRSSLQAAHSVTHLLHLVLRNTLGKHVTQQGSLVAEDRVRFDFSHGKSLTEDELEKIEGEVNNLIWENNQVDTKVTSKDEAVEKGAMALFGEKYGNEVRVVSMGSSLELCGGTHVNSTSEIGIFKISKESSIGSGIRRIEAFTRKKALKFLREQERKYITAINDYKNKIKEIEKTANANLNKLYTKIIKNVTPKISKIKNIELIVKILDGVTASNARGAIIESTQTSKKSVLLFFVNEGKKSLCFIGVTQDLQEKISATKLLEVVQDKMKIKSGGGKAGLAQCSANPRFFAEVVQSVEDYLK